MRLQDLHGYNNCCKFSKAAEEGMDAANAAWERALERGQAPGR
jgi:hypothetical protein